MPISVPLPAPSVKNTLTGRCGQSCARATADPMLRALVLTVAADLLAEACLQNLLNAVYHATVLILILCLAVAASRRPSPVPCSAMPLAPPLASR